MTCTDRAGSRTHRSLGAILVARFPARFNLAQADEIDLETQDRSGATALTLALKLGHTRAAHMLVRAGACPRARTPMEWEAHQLAAFTANTDLLRISVMAMLKDLDLAWERRLPKHIAKLKELPGEPGTGHGLTPRALRPP